MLVLRAEDCAWRRIKVGCKLVNGERCFSSRRWWWLANSGADRTVRFRFLGLFEVIDDHGRALALGGFKQRAVLMILLLHANEVVSSERLIDELWGERPPGSAIKTVQVYVSRLRRALGDGRLVTHGRGYVLRSSLARSMPIGSRRWSARVAPGCPRAIPALGVHCCVSAGAMARPGACGFRF